MATISFKGSGVAAVDPSLLGFGQGLQIGETKISFRTGSIQLSDSKGRQINMGFFSGLQSVGSPESNIKSFVFKAKCVCTIVIGKASYDYVNLNEWVTYNYISEQNISISRTATGQNPDVFDWQFFASDDPKFSFTIQQADRNSETEVIFSQSQRSNAGGGIFTQTTNLRGAKQIILIGNSPASVETGNVDITAEIFDVATNSWVPFLSKTDIFNLVQNQQKNALLGEMTGKKTDSTLKNYQFIYEASTGGFAFYEGSDVPPAAGGSLAVMNFNHGMPLPSGDNIFRIKATVNVAPLTFSLSIIKVFQ